MSGDLLALGAVAALAAVGVVRRRGSRSSDFVILIQVDRNEAQAHLDKLISLIRGRRLGQWLVQKEPDSELEDHLIHIHRDAQYGECEWTMDVRVEVDGITLWILFEGHFFEYEVPTLHKTLTGFRTPWTGDIDKDAVYLWRDIIEPQLIALEDGTDPAALLGPVRVW